MEEILNIINNKRKHLLSMAEAEKKAITNKHAKKLEKLAEKINALNEEIKTQLDAVDEKYSVMIAELDEAIAKLEN